MKIIHYFSGITLILFVSTHILNHLMILHSEPLHVRFMKKARKFYRHPVVELILTIAVVLQVITGIGLVIRWNKPAEMFELMQIISGLYLAFFLIVHVTAVVVGRYKMRVDTNLYYGAGVMNMWPHKLFFIPYYFLALTSFFVHLAMVHYHKMSVYISVASATTQSWLIIVTGLLIATLVVFRMARLKKPVLPLQPQSQKASFITPTKKRLV
jgi:hypothetical protein